MPSYRVIVHIGYVEVEVEAADSDGALTAATEQLTERAARIVTGGTFQVEQISRDEAAA